MNDSLELINSELQDLTEQHYAAQADLQWDAIVLSLKNVNFTLQDLANEVREAEIFSVWEDMMTEMYWNLCPAEEAYFD